MGTSFLRDVNLGKRPDLGGKVVVLAELLHDGAQLKREVRREGHLAGYLGEEALPIGRLEVQAHADPAPGARLRSPARRTGARRTPPPRGPPPRPGVPARAATPPSAAR